MIRRLTRYFARAILAFFILSLALVLLFKSVPVPITATMALDGEIYEHGLAKDWEPLSNIDRNLVTAVIAAEDSKFCSHGGFDTTAIAKAALNNVQAGAFVAAPPSASRPRRTSSCGRAAAISAKGWRRISPS